MKVTQTHTIKGKTELSGLVMASAIEINGTEVDLFKHKGDPAKLPFDITTLGLSKKQGEAFAQLRLFFRWNQKNYAQWASAKLKKKGVSKAEKDTAKRWIEYSNGWASKIDVLDSSFSYLAPKEPKAQPAPKAETPVDMNQLEELVQTNPAFAQALAAMMKSLS